MLQRIFSHYLSKYRFYTIPPFLPTGISITHLLNILTESLCLLESFTYFQSIFLYIFYHSKYLLSIYYTTYLLLNPSIKILISINLVIVLQF